MSSNTNTSRYKQVNRQARIQTREGAFSKGMMFTDKPLTEGYSKLLVNYDIDPLDGTLHTRKGLQAVGTHTQSAISNDAELFGLDKGFTNIVTSKTCALEKDFQQDARTSTAVVTYNTATNALNVNVLADIVDADDTFAENIIQNKRYIRKPIYKIQPLCSGTSDVYQVFPQSIIEPGIHSQKCVHDFHFKKPAGTFAFGDSYYAFSRHTSTTGAVSDELHCTKFYTQDTVPQDLVAQHTHPNSSTAGGYSDEPLYDIHVKAQYLNPSEAASAGYNMLAENPYAFTCETGANVSILGVLPYDSNTPDTPLLNLIVNKDVLFKAFYRAPSNPTAYSLNKVYDSRAYADLAEYTLYKRYTFNAATGEVTFQEEVVPSEVSVGQMYYTPANFTAMQSFYVLEKSDIAGEDTSYYVRIFVYDAVQGDKEYRVIWDWREVGAAQWSTIQDNITTLTQTPLTCSFRSAVEQLILRVTILDPVNTTVQPDGTVIEHVESTTAMGLQFKQSSDLSKQNVEPDNYNLATAKGMLEWKNRLVLWGVEKAETILFTSDVNNPTYFPYPHNVDVLEEPILHCMVYGDDLLAFTNTKLYRLTIGETGGIGAHTVVQKNLNISEKDIPMFCLVKNMLFFKSGNYYYMLVPKSSSITGETTIAPISNAISPFLDNFSKEVDKLFSIYTQGKTDINVEEYRPYRFSSFLEYYYAYADNESVVLNFVYDYSGFINGGPEIGTNYSAAYKAEKNSWHVTETNPDSPNARRPFDKRQFILSLIYDTTSYAWRIKIYETPNIVHPIYHSAVGQEHYIYFTEQVSGNSSNNKYGPIFVQCIKQSPEDSLILYQNALVDGIVDYASIPSLTEEAAFWQYAKLPIQPNYQYLDTGYRTLTGAVDIKKRFREVQFSINNVSQKALTFYTAFIVDGNLRKDMRGYTTKMMVDPDDPKTGVLLVERPYIDEEVIPEFVVTVKDYVSPDITPGDTTLNDTFVLDNTQLPDLAYWKIRVGVSGKGFVPRLQILSVNDKEYSLLSTNWVYRTMNSR